MRDQATSKVSIPKRVSEALNPTLLEMAKQAREMGVSIPKRVSEALNPRAISVIYAR